jgi:hypothetical protein
MLETCIRKYAHLLQQVLLVARCLSAQTDRGQEPGSSVRTRASPYSNEHLPAC